MLQANDSRVVSFYNHYHSKKAKFPNMYVDVASNQSINVVLPVNLSDYSNAAAGRFAVGSDGIIRPKGIRRRVNDAAAYIDNIFSSVENLAKFINSSECDGMAIARAETEKLMAVQPPVDPKDRMVRTVDLNKMYGQGTIQRLMTQYPKTARHDYNLLTIGEFELRYNLIPETA